MVKVTGGGKSVGAVGAHFAYLSRRDELEIETDEGERILDRDQKKGLLNPRDLSLEVHPILSKTKHRPHAK